MIAIIYPRDDFEAADIATKLAMSIEEIEIFPVPKYPGRNDKIAFEALDKADAVIFLQTAKVKLDKKTKREIDFVLSQGKAFYAITPEDDYIAKALQELEKLKTEKNVLSIVAVIILMILTIKELKRTR